MSMPALDDDTPIAMLRVSDLRRLIAEAVGAANDSEQLVDQRSSPLGPKRHAAACRRRMREDLPGASKVGRRWLMTRSALNEELAATGRAAPAERDAADLLRADLARL